MAESYGLNLTLYKLYANRCVLLFRHSQPLVRCLRQIRKLYNIDLSEKEYIDLLQLVNLYNFCLEKTISCDVDLLVYFSK